VYGSGIPAAPAQPAAPLPPPLYQSLLLASACTASAAAKQAMLGQGATACGSYTGVLDEHLMSVLSLPEPAQSALLQDLAVKSSLSVPPEVRPALHAYISTGWPHSVMSCRLWHVHTPAIRKSYSLTSVWLLISGLECRRCSGSVM
jgi:hypothetical protein